MSGICGIVLAQKDRQVNPTHLSTMTKALAMAAPCNGRTACLSHVGMGVQPFLGRLSEMVSSEVHGQPVVLAFSGSLYNWRELSFPSNSTANIAYALLSLYGKEKLDFLRRLRGEFILALWDGAEDTCYIATDRFRVHPLFYYQDQDTLVFASRMKGLLACPLVKKRTLCPDAIVDVVASSVIPTPKTIFQEIDKLPSGSLLTYRHGESRVTTYWDINFLDQAATSEEELARQLKTQFRDAISVRFAEDREPERIGTFLSGGVDSSTVTGILTQLAQRPIKSFSIGFDEQGFNETNYARIAAKAFGAEYHEYFVTPQDVCDVIPILLDTFDEPFANASAVPTYFCARLAREHGVDVLYAGDGGDELFAGNERYAAQRVFEYYDRIPRRLRTNLVKPLVFALADMLQWNLFVKGKKYIQRSSLPYSERLSSYGFFKTVSLQDWLTEDLLSAVGRSYDPYAPVSAYYLQAPAGNPLDRQMYLDLKLAITDNDLFKVTRMTEAAAVTVRYPFLDHHLAEFAATVPATIKMRDRELRTFFKKAYADLLPRETLAKQKHGFGLPIPVWLRTDKRLNEMMHDLLLSPRSVQRGYFRRKALEDLVRRHREDEGSFYGAIVWNLMILELWHRTYL